MRTRSPGKKEAFVSFHANKYCDCYKIILQFLQDVTEGEPRPGRAFQAMPDALKGKGTLSCIQSLAHFPARREAVLLCTEGGPGAGMPPFSAKDQSMGDEENAVPLAGGTSPKRSVRPQNGVKRKSKLHPDPMRAREGWVSLDGEWEFALDAQGSWDRPEDVQWDRHIEVPFAPETKASGIGNTGYCQACWYRRTFKPPRLKDGQRLILHFGAVDYAAAVWINDRMACRHEGGYTPFHVDVTAHLARGLQAITLQARDDPHDLAKPRGKQDWQLHPHSIWYPRTTGIWQSVWMEVVGSSWLDRFTWQPDFERFALNFHGHIAHFSPDLWLHVELKMCENLLADDMCKVTSDEVQRHVMLADPGIEDGRQEWVWSPERPTLLNATLTLQDGQGKVMDRVSSYTAMRQASTLGDRFMLNGRPRFLRLVLDQGYWPDSGLTPPHEEAIKRDIELILAMGFNGVRAHQRVAVPQFLYFADVMGLMVWGEMPGAYRFSAQMVQRLTQEWMEVIQRDVGHPCIIAWVPLNESWGVPDLPSNPMHRSMARALYHLTKAMDAAWSLGYFANRGVVYDCMDELSQFSGAPPQLLTNEKRLMQYADVVFTGGQELCAKKKESHPNVHFFGCGVEANHFGLAMEPSTTIPPDIDFLNKPVLGWFGVIDERVDYHLVAEMARLRPDWSFAMVGPIVKVDPNLIPHAPNLYWLGGRDYSQLPNYCKAFDVCMMCFAINDATQYINPTKALEYLATGRPVITTPVSDVVRQYSDLMDIGSTAAELVVAAERAIQSPDMERIQRGIERARRSSWENTVASMQQIILNSITQDDRPSSKTIDPLTNEELNGQFIPTPGS